MRHPQTYKTTEVWDGRMYEHIFYITTWRFIKKRWLRCQIMSVLLPENITWINKWTCSCIHRLIFRVILLSYLKLKHCNLFVCVFCLCVCLCIYIKHKISQQPRNLERLLTFYVLSLALKINFIVYNILQTNIRIWMYYHLQSL